MIIYRKTILIILISLLFFSFSYSQIWNEHLVNAGEIDNPQSLIYKSDGNPIIIHRLDRTVMITVWTGTSWNTQNVFWHSSYLKISSCTLIDSLVHIVLAMRGSTTHSYSLEHLIVNLEGDLVSQKSICSFSSSGYASTTYDSIQNYLLLSNSGPLGDYAGLQFYYYDLSTETWSDLIFVDGTPGVGEYNDITFSSSGDVWISYYDSNLKDLKVARSKPDGSWDTWFVDSSGDVGTYSQIWVDAQNIAHIAYYDATNQSLKCATFNP